MHEKLIQELEEERHLRLKSEKKLREVALESERHRVQMRGLQQQFSRMEETVRNLLKSQGLSEPDGEEPVTILKSYQETLMQEGKQCKTGVEDIYMADKNSRNENSSEGEKAKAKLLLERLKALEAENSALTMENKNQREQYERCLDEVANQVVQALLTQKDLREECLKLKTRVFDLEQQNRTLNVLFQQRMKPTSGLLLQECQQNMKSGIPALKCQNQLNMLGPHRICSRSSCSSSELSLSSTCSEYSSSSSWNDGKAYSKKSVTWNKRISIASSLPSNHSSPADELPPIHIKENHILDGLKKLQKRKGLLEPSSVLSKWGYKDCMDSNEGIYSPGIKYSSQAEQARGMPKIEAAGRDHQKIFVYDSDSHEDTDDDSSSFTLLYEVPKKDCRHYCNKLTHSVSDSLFGWEPDRRHLSKVSSYFNSKERPEKLTSFVNEVQSGAKSCTNMKLPMLQIDKSLANVSWRDLNLHLSDTDDNEMLDELHIESSDEKSPSYLSLAPFADKNTENSDMHMEEEKTQLASSEKRSNQLLTHSDIRTKACNFMKQQKIIKKTSSEECITVIFDAEDGKPIEFNSHQTGVVTVTRNAVSINHPYSGSSAENTKYLPQGISDLQRAIDAKNYHVMQQSGNKTGRKTAQNHLDNDFAGVYTSKSSEYPVYFGRPLFQNSPEQKRTKQDCAISSNSSSLSNIQADDNKKQKLAKILSRDRLSPQKTKMAVSENSPSISSYILKTLDKSPGSSTKCTRPRKLQNPNQNSDSKVGLNNRKALVHSPAKSQQSPSIMPPQPLIEPVDGGEKPIREVHCDVPLMDARSPSTCQSPGGSASLLMRPNYEHSPPELDSPATNFLSATITDAVQLSPLKGSSVSVCHNIRVCEMQTNKCSVTPRVELSHLHSKGEGKSILEKFSTTCQVIPKAFSKKMCSPDSNQSVFCSNREHNSRAVPAACIAQDINLLSKESGEKQKPKFPDSFSTSPDHHIRADDKQCFLTQLSPSSVPLLLQDNDNGNQKNHLPVGYKLLKQSPQFVRQRSPVPGKQERDCVNAVSKCGVNSDNQKQGESLSQTTIDFADAEERNLEHQTEEDFSNKFRIDPAFSTSPESDSLIEQDGFENKSAKRSVSSNSKAYLKPVLGMNGAKARSQSFIVNTEEMSPVPSPEGLGKVRTQIITNTSERGNSLTRQNSATEGLQIKAISESVVMAVPNISYPRHGSCANMSSSSTQMGSPSKLPFHMSPRGNLFAGVSEREVNKSVSQTEVPSISGQVAASSEISKHPSINEKNVTQAEMVSQSSTIISSQQILPLQTNLNNTECHCKPEGNKAAFSDACSNGPRDSDKVSASTPLQPTIEEKVMLCIQENMQKGQGQNQANTEIKPKNIASWFGFRRSKLPAISNRKTDTSKGKVEKKDAKVSAFGSKPTKSEKRKEKKKTEQHCEAAKETNKKTLNCGVLNGGPKGKKIAKAIHGHLSQTGSEQKNSPVATYSGKDSFMKELLHRVDKKAAQQPESGSKNVSYRSLSKSISQGTPLPSNSVDTQRNQKKNSKTKLDLEISNETLVKAVRENFQEDAEDTLTDSTNQSHLIESCCQMRTLDSGIGTFPLPDSGNRSTGRHVSKQGLDLGNEGITSPEQAFPQAPSGKAKTLEREVPSTTNKNQGSAESMISHSASDPAMADKSIQTFQSRLPKPASAGITSPVKQSRHEASSLTSTLLEHREKDSNIKMFPDWSSKKAIKAKEKTLRVCTYSASSSSDTETELEYETNDFGTRGEMMVDLMKNNKKEIEAT